MGEGTQTRWLAAHGTGEEEGGLGLWHLSRSRLSSKAEPSRRKEGGRDKEGETGSGGRPCHRGAFHCGRLELGSAWDSPGDSL